VTPLLGKQLQFPYLLAELLHWAYQNGYQVTLGEAYRSDEQAEINALGPVLRERLADMIVGIPQFALLAAKIRNNQGSGVRTSLHGDRLAIDLNLFVNGRYEPLPEAYRPLGEQWEKLGGTWGGRFGDANHFSIAFEGRK
jgi:hypothetical protein